MSCEYICDFFAHRYGSKFTHKGAKGPQTNSPCQVLELLEEVPERGWEQMSQQNGDTNQGFSNVNGDEHPFASYVDVQ